MRSSLILGEKGPPPIDRQQWQLQGSFCTLGPNQVVSPIKILFDAGCLRLDAPQRPDRLARHRGSST